MIHVLMTPPDADPADLDAIGVLHVGCVPPWAERVLVTMAEEDWIIQVVLDPPGDFPEDSPPRQRAQKYFDDFMASHRGLDPRVINN